jgi:hypothetical protein
VEPLKTIGVDLWAGQARGEHENRQTCISTSPRLTEPRALRDLFMGAYAKFSALCREVDEPGLALLAVDEYTGAPAGLVRLRARFGRHVAAVIGRHDQCDLFLDKHSSLALRHLAVVLDPVQSWASGSTNVHYRVLDLRTERGFLDEHGGTMRGLTTEGPAIVRCAGHGIFIMPLGDPSDWPEDPRQAWDMLPERVYLDELRGDPRGSLTNLPVKVKRNTSAIFRTLGPRDTGVGLVDRGDVAGTLEIRGPKLEGRLTLGERALRDGVLLGRYARCDGAALLDDPSLSRVHVLLLHVDGALLAIDTASRNGTHLVNERKARVITLGNDTDVHLGKQTRIRWRWTA